MKRILHIPNYYNPHIGGIEQTAEDIVESLKDKYEQKVICFKDEKHTVTDVVNGIEVKRVSCIAKVASQSIAPSYKRELKKTMKEFNPDIVVFHYPNPFVAAALIPVLKKYKNAKLVLYWHTDIVKQKLIGKLFNGQNKKLLKRACVVIATSPNYAEGSVWLQSVNDKLQIVPSCVHYHECDEESVLKEVSRVQKEYSGRKLIFALGRQVEHKGYQNLIEATKYLPDDYVAVIGGGGPYNQTLKEMSANNFKVVLPGRLENATVEAFYRCSDVFAFPSLTKNEAFGLALAEAMLNGCPAVTFSIPGSGVNYVNLADVTGLEVENGNSKALAEAIIKIASNAELREKFSQNAKERVNELFTFEKFKENISKVVEKL